MNLDYRHWTYDELALICKDLRQNLKVGIVRTVLKPNEQEEWNKYRVLLRTYGIDLLAVQARESGDIEQYEFYMFDYLQVGNEPFNDGGSSFQQSAQELNRMVSRARRFYPDTIIIMAGLADGDETKLDLLDLDKVDFIACHPGVETPETINSYLDRYYEHSNGLKIIVSEFYNPLLTKQLLVHPYVEQSMFFCYDDKMVKDHGLYNHGVKKPAYDVYYKQVNGDIPVADLNVGAGVLAEMTVHDDVPIRDSEFFTNVNGTVYEKGFGEKGTYEASNANGEWRIYFRPFQ